jgi:hypothetical protein
MRSEAGVKSCTRALVFVCVCVCVCVGGGGDVSFYTEATSPGTFISFVGSESPIALSIKRY